MKRYEVILFDGGNIVADRDKMNVVDYSVVELNHDENIYDTWYSLVVRNGLEPERYARHILYNDGSERIDFGSYSHFIYIKEIA